MRVLVTGAAGFVGAHLCRLLLEEPGWQVAAISRQPARTPLVGATSYQVDLLDPEATSALLAAIRPTVIIHLAAQSSVAISLRDPAATLTSNQLMQLNLLEGCRLNGLDPLCLIASSIDVYGDSARDSQPLTERSPLRPLSPYAVSKITQEMLGRHYYLSHGLRVVLLRLCNHIGPGQRPDFAIPNFARQIALSERGEQPARLAVGNLSVRRDFLDVRDVATAYRLAIHQVRPGAVYNVGSGQAQAIGTVVDQMVAQARVAMRVEVDPDRWRPADIPISLVDASAFRLATGWQPMIGLEQTIGDILDDWRRWAAGGAG